MHFHMLKTNILFYKLDIICSLKVFAGMKFQVSSVTCCPFTYYPGHLCNITSLKKERACIRYVYDIY